MVFRCFFLYIKNVKINIVHIINFLTFFHIREVCWIIKQYRWRLNIIIIMRYLTV